MRLKRTCLVGFAIFGLACGSARAELGLALEGRLSSLVGRDEPEARWVIEWSRPPSEGTAIELLRYEPGTREVRARFTGPKGEETVTGKVMLVGLVPTPTRAIAPGEVVTPDSLRELEIDLLDAHRDLVRGPGLALDRTARRALNPGRPILARDLKVTLAVARNDIVTLEARLGAISLRTRAKAIDGGAVGDTIRVQNIDSRRLLTGTIVEPGVVAVGG